MPSEMGRYFEELELVFDAAATVSDTINISRFITFGFMIPAEFNGDTLTVSTGRSGDVAFTFTGATGRYTPTSAQALALAPMDTLQITTGSATSAAATITVLAKT
jgi:hypothetical protein